jgi:hypothetical protein
MEERRVITTLSALPEAAQALTGPAMMIIGEVAALAQISASAERGAGSGATEAARAGGFPNLASESMGSPLHHPADGPPPPLRRGGER